jgi:alpha-tubulin suppressor-like RCC1 family protein
MTSHTRQINSALGAVLLLATACGDDGAGPDTPPGPPAAVEISPQSAAVPIDTTLALTATVTDSTGRVIPDAKVRWSSRDPAIATVDSTGLVRGVTFGAVSISATVAGKVGGAIANVVLRWRTISAGGSYTCGVTVTGVAYCWGNNAAGQLGIAGADFIEHPKPVLVSTTLKFRAIAASPTLSGHTCAITGTGALYCWGANGHGELGTGDAVSAFGPRAAKTTQSFTSVSVGDAHSCALSSQGKAYCWGDNSAGQLGAAAGDTLTVKPVDGAFVFTAVSAGPDFTCALTLASAVYCWGGNASGQLGLGTAGSGVAKPTRAVPTLLLAAIASGRGAFTCGAAASAGAYCWGANASGQLGRGFASAREPGAATLSGAPPLVSVVAGLLHACGLAADGGAWCWGGAGFLGSGSGSGSNAPMRVLQPEPFALLSAGTNHTCALTASGTAYCWGRNDLGQLGTGSVSAVATVPAKVADRP